MENRQKDKKIKPKQYSHIDYEALLIYSMKKGVSLEKSLERHGLSIARSTIERNISKINNQSNGTNEVINLYKNGYIPNMQKVEMPEDIRLKIASLPEKDVIIKDELEELYDKLSKMKQILDESQGNFTAATRKINSGTTSLGKVHISIPGFIKNIKRYEIVKKAIESKKEREER